MTRQQQIEEWCKAMCSLLDLIEMAANDGDIDRVQRLCGDRFKIAQDHGVEVIIDGSTASGKIQ